MNFRIRTLTPLWTGDINGKSTKPRETSIIGSLRWWFEAIVRGFGGNACNSVTNKCEYKHSVDDICPVCKLVGTTGWSKRFKFTINQGFCRAYDGNLIIRGGSRSWYFPSGLLPYGNESNEIKQIFPLLDKINTDKKEGGETEVNVKSLLKTLLAFVSQWGMIGGKTAIGYGVVKFEENKTKMRPTNNEITEFLNFITRQTGKNAENAPKLSEMFFVKVKITDECVDEVIRKIEGNVSVKNGMKQFPSSIFGCKGTEKAVENTKVFLQDLKDCYGFLPTSALIRKVLRDKIREKWQNNNELRYFLMGKLGKSSAIQVSHMYWNGEEWKFRIWAWIPEDTLSNYGVDRSDIMNFIMQTLDDKNFWNNIFGNHRFIEKSEEDKIIIKYPNTGWNLIDFGDFEKGKINDVFKNILLGGENE